MVRKFTISSRCMGKELNGLSEIERAICPDLFHPAIARDGLLTRLRIPGAILTTHQCQTIAEILEAIGLDYLQVTNRANLQLRSIDRDLAPELLTKLTDCGLAASNPTIDGIRSIMLSPTAGIDLSEAIDFRPIAAAWCEYLDRHPELGILSTKFSVGFDGGGRVSIIDRPNDIALLAVSDRELSLHLSMGDRGDPPQPVGVYLSPDECVPTLAAIAQTYRHGIEAIGGNYRRKPRLRDVIRHYGLDEFGAIVASEYEGSKQFAFANTERASEPHPDRYFHLDAHRQRQPDRYYLGIVLLLGKWTIRQIWGLAEIASRYGSSHIRLTPWQNLLLPDIQTADLEIVRDLVSDLGLVHTADRPSSLLRACAGNAGCQFSATDTQADAIDLCEYLEAQQFTLDRPVSIHFSGCDKSCAQHDRADITLWGVDRHPDGVNGYHLEIAGDADRLGARSSDIILPAEVPMAIARCLGISS